MIFTKDEFAKLKPGKNKVLIRPYPNEFIKYGTLELLNAFASRKDKWLADNPAQHEGFMGEVIRIGDLNYRKEFGYNQPFDADMELKEGDKVWTNYIILGDVLGNMENAKDQAIHVDDETYAIVPYSQIYARKRGDEVVGINGYCLLEPLRCDPLSKKLWTPEQPYGNTAIVRYLATPLRGWNDRGELEFNENELTMDIKVGDKVQLQHDFFKFLEPDLYHTLPFYPLTPIQRRSMLGILT
jgi:hypothetical protein